MLSFYKYGCLTALLKLGTPIWQSARESERQRRKIRGWLGLSPEPLRFPEYSLTSAEKVRLPQRLQQTFAQRLQENRGTSKFAISLDNNSFGNDTRAELSVGDTGGHQEAVEENDPRPKRMHPSTLANAPRTSGDPSKTISRAFDSHDAITPREVTHLPHTEYIG